MPVVEVGSHRHDADRHSYPRASKHTSGYISFQALSQLAEKLHPKKLSPNDTNKAKLITRPYKSTEFAEF